MLEIARRPRHLALLTLATVFAVIFVLLGLWQYGVAQQDAREEALRRGPQQPVVALNQLIGPHEPFPASASLRRVDVSGRYDSAKQFIVVDRRLQGRAGYWVVTPLIVDSTGARLPVLRGFVTDPQAAVPAPTGPVTVRGALAPAESPLEGAPLPAGQHRSVDVGTLLNDWGGDVYNAFIFVIDHQPAETAAGLDPVPPPSPEVGGLDWRNLGYAVQWWVFAGFAFYLWWRSVREDQRDELAAAQPLAEGADESRGEGQGNDERDRVDHPAPDVRPEDLHV